MRYKIEGNQRLKGEIKISGNKNSVLPCMAAALLTKEEVTLENVPEIKDVEVFTKIFQELGINVIRKKSSIKIQAMEIKTSILPNDLVNKLRASILLTGPVLSRKGKVKFDFPGGDSIGKRNIDVHLSGFKTLGALITQNESFEIELDKGRVDDAYIFLEEASVTGTENLILANVCGISKVEIRNAAIEPHVTDLCKMLKAMGAKIEGIGTDWLKIEGVKKLSGVKFRVSDDHIQFGTYAILAAITKSWLKLSCNKETDLVPIIAFLSKFGIEFTRQKEGFIVGSKNLKSIEKIVTNIWPGFPTDLMSLTIVLATQSRGLTLCHDWMFESRMFFAKQLIKMGASIRFLDPYRVEVNGPTKLHGEVLECGDIRAGMALVLAALIAEGNSIIEKAELIERGYEDVVGNFSKLGAKISKA